MAVELERTVMMEIGLGNNYRWFNGSGSCRYIRQGAVGKLAEAARKHGLSIASTWLARCKVANQVDAVDSGEYGLTNTWVSCSYAIQDAIYRKEGGDEQGFDPPGDEEGWQFFSDEKRKMWRCRKDIRGREGFLLGKGRWG